MTTVAHDYQACIVYPWSDSWTHRLITYQVALQMQMTRAQH